MASVGDVIANSGFLYNAFGSAWTSWSYMIPILGLISLLIVVLLHMIAIAFNIPSLRVWVKGEYMQVIATYVLFGAIFALIMLTWGIMGNFVTQAYYGSPELSAQYGQGVVFDPYAFVQAFLKQTMIDCETNIYRGLYAINFFYKIVGSTKTETMGIEPVGGWYTTVYTSFFEYIMENLNFLLLMHWLQIRLLSVMKYTAPLLIQLGLLLRVFPMSRGTGGLLLAAGLGFFAVYPISLAMLVTLQSPGVSFCTQFTPPAMLDVAQVGEGVDAGTVATAYYSIVSNENEVTSFVEKAKNFIPLFYMQAMFYPLVALIITFTFIRQTGAIFGSDLNEIGRGLVKLV
ncbi:MAG: hypothetical protein V1822_02135 [Candidatus Micrarchaeota archaeon]